LFSLRTLIDHSLNGAQLKQTRRLHGIHVIDVIEKE